MGQELGGPITIEAQAEFMKNDVWNVHHTYHVEMLYPKNVRVILDNKFENGLRFEGSEGWVFCTRSSERVTSSDPDARDPRSPLRASDPGIIAAFGADAVHWPASRDHYLNWLESISADRDPIAPVDQAARSLEACCASWIAMKLKRKLTWDVANESFVADARANAMIARKPRLPEYDFNESMRRAGLA
jgi:hypothetical protein